MSTVVSTASTLILDPASVFEGEASGIEKVALNMWDGVEGVLIRYKKGEVVPVHRHNNDTLKIVLRGALEITDEDGMVGICQSGDLHPCTVVAPYGVTALEDTLVLLVQPPHTKRIDLDK